MPGLGTGWYRLRATWRRRAARYAALAVLIGLAGGVAAGAVTAARRTELAALLRSE